jgi:hypothetical protein
MCIGGSTRVPDMHRRVKIRYGADPRAVHDREPDMDRHHPRPVLCLAITQPILEVRSRTKVFYKR